MHFTKMHGLGNDFIILDLRDGSPLPPIEKIAALTHRKTGIGCDQFIIMLPSEKGTCFMKILNAPDASEVEACGNATRCVADILLRESGKDKVVIETLGGLLECWRESDERITTDMGVPKLGWEDIPLSEERDTLHLLIGEGEAQDPVGVNVGNPHAVFFVDDAENFPVREIGPKIEHHPLFPRKANIEFATIIDRENIRMRVWERDAGETDACGSGASATIVAAVRRDLVNRKCAIHLNGGTLNFHWREIDDHILMTGAVAYVFDGETK